MRKSMMIFMGMLLLSCAASEAALKLALFGGGSQYLYSLDSVKSISFSGTVTGITSSKGSSLAAGLYFQGRSIRVSIPGTSRAHLDLYSLEGRRMQGWDLSLDNLGQANQSISGLPYGIYFAKATSSTGAATQVLRFQWMR